MNMETEEPEVNNVKPQLDQEEPDSEDDSADVLTQTLWEQAETQDQFAPQVLKALCSEARHHSQISLTECEEQNNFLYFWDRKYVLNSDCLHLQIIQLAHNSIARGHLGRLKTYELISHAYWWLNVYKYVQHFVWNCHICSRSKPSCQRTKRIFEKNSLVIELKLPEFMKVHSVFHITLLSHVTTDPLPGQCQEPWESVITENSERAWYVTRIFNSKVNQRFNSLLLKYYVEWEGYFPTWEPFYLMNNCQQALDEYHAAYPAAEGPHVHPCTISACQCHGA